MSSPREQGAIAVDTGVFAATLTPGSPAMAKRYCPLLEGRQLVITAQTVAELYFGAHKAGWGRRRLQELEQRIAQATVAPWDAHLPLICAELRAQCFRNGHALANKIHTSDLWVAATAIYYDIPLVSDDGIFEGVPGLELLTPDSALG